MNIIPDSKRTSSEAGLKMESPDVDTKKLKLSAQDEGDGDKDNRIDRGNDKQAGDDVVNGGNGGDDNILTVQIGEKRIQTVSKRAQTMMINVKHWKASNPTCFSEKFAFFYSADNHNYNKDNNFMAQTKHGCFMLHGEEYKSAYHYYSCERAKVIEHFNLQKTEVLENYNFTAADVVKMFKDADGGILTCAEMKLISYGFKWTEEAEALWESRVRRVLYLANFYKFTWQSRYRALLLNTGDKYLVKACPQKCVCTCGIRHEFLIAMDYRDKWGRNLLGKTLMMLRRILWEAYPAVPIRPTKEQLDAVWAIDSIDDGRNHLCHECSAFYIS